jgi:hypothetical protein
MNLTLTQRLAIVFALLLLVCSGTSAWLQLRSNRMHELEVVQALSRDVAESIARDAQLTDANGLMPNAVRNLFNQLMMVNPSVEVYLLEPMGALQVMRLPKGVCAATGLTWSRFIDLSMVICCPSWATIRAAEMAARSSAQPP